MISAERNGAGFRIKVNDPGFGRYTMQAATAKEVVNTVAHYWGQEHDEDNCAACKRIAWEQRKRK